MVRIRYQLNTLNWWNFELTVFELTVHFKHEMMGESNRATIVEENLIGCWESSAANQIFSAIVALSSL